MHIYYDHPNCQHHVERLNLQTATNSAVFQVPFPYDRGAGEAFEQRLDQALLNYDRIAILVSELHQRPVEFCLRYQNPKIKYFTCGFIKGIDSVPWMDWFITSIIFYKTSNVLNQLTPYQPKDKFFDILLGLEKPHRDIIYNYIIDNNLNNKVLMSYLKEQKKIVVGEDHSGWIWETKGLNIDPGIDLTWTVTQIKYYGHTMSLSQVVPISIYNQTAYSVVAESNYFNYFNFYTEKIVKPILAERLFIVVAGQHYLKNLRSLGFKTFNDIIDETYDDIEDDNTRFKLVCEQIKYLTEQPQDKILEKIRPIAEHNRQIMLTTDWYGIFSKRLREFLLAHTEQN